MSANPTSMLGLAQRIWDLFDPARRRECVGVVSISIVAACLTLAGVAGIAPFFAVLADPTVIVRNSTLAWLQTAFAIETSRGMVVLLGIGFVALLLLANAANFVSLFAIGRFSQDVGAWMHSRLFNEYLHRGLEFHASNNSATLSTRVVQDVSRTVGGVIQSGLSLCSSAVSIVLIATAVIVVDPLVAAAAVAVLGGSYALVYTLVRHRLIRNGTIITDHWKARAQIIAQSFTAMRDVMVNRSQPTLTAQIARHSAAIAEAQASTPAIAAAPRYVLECVTGAGLVAAALWMYATADSGQWLTHLMFLAFAAYRLLPAIQQAFAAAARIHSERPAFDAIADDLHRAREHVSDAPRSPRDYELHGRPQRSIRLVDVSYQHSAERTGGVVAVSLEIPAGTLAAFVGPNGAGKSTLAELVLGLRTPDTGRIEIDGVELTPANRSAWLETVAYVPQQIALFDGTLAQNIAFELTSQDVDLGRVREAASWAQLEPVIAALPAGLATVIGENGTQLSGGQRQRVGLARALYRRASLLVVDEGTNALDALTEAEVLKVLRTTRGRSTAILIAHRASSLDGCDFVVELHGGKLVSRTALAPETLLRETARR